MSLSILSPAQAKRLIDDGAVLIDIRESDEHAREKIPGARHAPLSKLDEVNIAVDDGKPVIFHCRSGARTVAAGAQLAGRAGNASGAHVIGGGLEAWKKAGLPVSTDKSAPLELQRQVQIGAGSLALIGTLLGLWVSPWFLAIPAFVGAGLITAGVTGFCGMAKLLLRAPWNRVAVSQV